MPVDAKWLAHPGSCFVEVAENYQVDGRQLTGRPDAISGFVEAPGIQNLTRLRAKLNLTARSGETICISEKDDLGWVAAVLLLK
jgi:hypothetical protein